MTRLKIWLALLSVSLLLPSTAWPEVWASSGFEDSPANSDQASAGAGKIRDTRGEARKRLETEHFFGDTAASEDDDNGLHRIGSARCYMQDEAPTGLFDSHSGIGLITDLTDYNTGGTGEGALNNIATGAGGAGIEDDIGHGRCWIDIDGADGVTNDDCTGSLTDDNTGFPSSGGTNTCCTASNAGTCDQDDNKMYIYLGVAGDAGSPSTGLEAGWQEIHAAAAAPSTGANVVDITEMGTLATDDQLLEGSFNYVYNGSFDIGPGDGTTTGCTGCAAGAAGLPAGWNVETGTTPTVAYIDPSADIRWGDGLSVRVTNAGSTNEGISYEMDGLPASTTFKVIARADDDGTAVCTLDVTGESGADFTSTATTTNAYETLSGTFTTTAALDNDVIITLTTTGADLLICNWDHVGVYQTGSVITERDEVAPPGVVAVFDTYTTSPGADIEEEITGFADVPELSIVFTPPTQGWVIQIGASVSLGCDETCNIDTIENEGYTCRLESGGSIIAGTLMMELGDFTADFSLADTTDFSALATMTAITINPAPGTPITYTVACHEVGTNDIVFNYQQGGDRDSQSNLWMIAYPPH